LMLREESGVGRALLKHRQKIARAVNWVTNSLAAGGRVFYVGAGTSGRLGVLDASECPPTFRADPEMIQGIIAGGREALWQAVEGAEDDAAAGAEALRFRGLEAKDVVIGIAASGRTPFVWGAIAEARKRKARSVLLCFNPSLKIQSGKGPDLFIAPDLGPEVLTGSTRLKSGTATKLILNILSTLAMVRLGKVVSNLMVDLNPSNVKLRERAIRIVQELTGTTKEKAQTALEQNGWVVKKAWQTVGKRAAVAK
jgi:N-acetylmuramic acid 6-phosphate etherase